MNTPTRSELFPYDTPPWRPSHAAASPDGAVVAAIDAAVEHSMGNPTVGTLRTSDGLVLPGCNPAFLWADDSRFLVVPRWCRRFGLVRRQRLVVVDVAARAVYASPFTHWLMQPVAFERGRLEVLVSSPLGISWPRRRTPLVLEVPGALSAFARLAVDYE